jgi:hypothetical protein
LKRGWPEIEGSGSAPGVDRRGVDRLGVDRLGLAGVAEA